MVLDMSAVTETATCVIFDPASLLELHRAHPDPAPDADRVDDEAEAGNYLLLETGSDGRFKFRAYVEEAAPPELLARAFHQERDGLLRVPSGTLCAAGAEQALFRGPPPGTAEAKVPAGDYRVEAYLLDASDDEGGELPVDGVIALGCAGTVALVVTALLFLGTNDWEFQVPSAAILIALALFWPPVIYANNRPAVRAARKKAAEEATPTLVLQLRRLGDGEDRANLKGLLLRPPEVQEERRRERERARAKG